MRVLQVAYTNYEDTGCKPTCKNPSAAGLYAGEDKVDNVRLLIFCGPCRCMLNCLNCCKRRKLCLEHILKFQKLELDQNAPNHESALSLFLSRGYHELTNRFC